MPKIKVEHVVSFSSEDPVHIANNILNIDPAKKWKCQKPGEMSAYIILQLEKAAVITGIDIGNEHSAFVEVLVARSGSVIKESDYKVLLVMSSFMSPIQSKQSTYTNQVRMFRSEQLCLPERNEKWDRIKIVCTQPFNRHVQYGLSFVILHSAGEANEAESPKATIRRFTLRPPSPDLQVGSSFAKWKEENEAEIWTAAAAIRQATKASLSGETLKKPDFQSIQKLQTTKQLSPSQTATPQPRNRNNLLYNEDDEAPNQKIDKIMEEANKEFTKKKEKEVSKAATEVQDPSSLVGKRKTSSTQSGTSRKKAKCKQKKTFDRLLEGVTLVISGIVNPERGTIREMALDMGAKYERDWKHNCTHLICAFPNTPKFNQVKGKGKIVTRKWIEDCHSQRKRLPWRRYALDRADQGKAESEEEILEELQTVRHEHLEDACVRENIDSNIQQKDSFPGNVYDDDTEEEIIEKDEKNMEGELPMFFRDFTFYLDPKFSSEDRDCMRTYIIAYGGSIEDHPNINVNVIVTNNREGISDKNIFNPSTEFVKHDWIRDCHTEKRALSFENYKS